MVAQMSFRPVPLHVERANIAACNGDDLQPVGIGVAQVNRTLGPLCPSPCQGDWQICAALACLAGQRLRRVRRRVPARELVGALQEGGHAMRAVHATDELSRPVRVHSRRGDE